MQFSFKSNLDLILREIERNNKAAADKVGELCVEGTQYQMLYGYHDVHGLPDNPHTEIVDTGRLFDSIEADVRKTSQNAMSISVGTDVPYAKYVHDGTHKLKGRPFLADGIDIKRDEIRQITGDEWKRGF